jgi:hypothetical protein
MTSALEGKDFLCTALASERKRVAGVGDIAVEPLSAVVANPFSYLPLRDISQPRLRQSAASQRNCDKLATPTYRYVTPLAIDLLRNVPSNSA